jgi:hypothetical protein
MVFVPCHSFTQFDVVFHQFTKVARCHDLLLGDSQIIPFEAWRALQFTDGEHQHHAELPPDQLEIDCVRHIEYRPNADGMQPGCKAPPMRSWNVLNANYAPLDALKA